LITEAARDSEAAIRAADLRRGEDFLPKKEKTLSPHDVFFAWRAKKCNFPWMDQLPHRTD
jgi:hypothetical protein